MVNYIWWHQILETQDSAALQRVFRPFKGLNRNAGTVAITVAEPVHEIIMRYPAAVGRPATARFGAYGPTLAQMLLDVSDAIDVLLEAVQLGDTIYIHHWIAQ